MRIFLAFVPPYRFFSFRRAVNHCAQERSHTLEVKVFTKLPGITKKIPSLVSMVGDIEKSSKKIDGFFRLGHEPSNIRVGSFLHRGNCTLTAALFGRFWPTELLDWGRIDCRGAFTGNWRRRNPKKSPKGNKVNWSKTICLIDVSNSQTSTDFEGGKSSRLNFVPFAFLIVLWSFYVDRRREKGAKIITCLFVAYVVCYHTSFPKLD